MNYNSFVYDLAEETDCSIEIVHAVVEFRPFQLGISFGFDWFRIGDYGDNAFSNIILPVESLLLVSDWQEHHSNLVSLEREYDRMRMMDAHMTYYVPYLTLFPEKYSTDIKDEEKPPYTAELKMSLMVIKDLEKIEFDFDETLFSITIGGEERKDLPKDYLTRCEKYFLPETLCISCHTGAEDGFSEKKEIKVWAYLKDDTGLPSETMKRKLAGKIIVLPNSNFHREEKKVVFVKVKTNIENKRIDIPDNKGVQGKEISRLKKALYQSLTYAATEKYSDVLDLTDNNDFKIIKEGGKEIFGKFIYQKGVTQVPDGIDKDKTTSRRLFIEHSEFFPTLRQLFLDLPENIKYKDHIIVFYFEESAYDTFTFPDGNNLATLGQTGGDHKKTIAIFIEHKESTLAHEILHACGLVHPFDEQSKHRFQKHMTDNIMDYRKDTNEPFKTLTWAWQWKIVNRKLRI